jgi:predicted phosphodiesterase
MHLFRRVAFHALGLAFAASGCAPGDTTRHLLSVGDSARMTTMSGTAAASDWAAPSFADQSWAAKVTAFDAEVPAMPSDLLVRSSFDIGADYAAFRQLTLTFAPGAPYDVFLNGQAVAKGDGKADVTIPVTDGVLHATGNVLGLDVHAVATGTLSIAPQLDGTADANLIKSGPAMVERGPWLLSPRADGVTIVWETSRAAASRVVVDGQTVDGGNGTHHVAQVSGLVAAHNYSYHVEVEGRAGDELAFTTAPADTSKPLRFIVYGDNRTDGDAHRRVVDAMRNEGADFIVNTGDLVNASTDGEWQTFFDIEYALLAGTPLYPTIGNHEDSSGGAGRFAQLFPLGKPDQFGGCVYSFDYGSSHFAVLDSNLNLADQKGWLDADLTAAEKAGARHLFIVMHWGPYSGRVYFEHGSNMDARLYIEPIARKHQVDAVLSGHDHFYERGNANGLHYFISGGGGAPLVGTGKIASTQVTRSANHYVVVDVSGDVAHATAKDDTGTAFDSVDLVRGQ